MTQSGTIKRKNVYEQVTNQIVAELEKGVPPWRKPWAGDHAAGSVQKPRRFDGTPYRGINVCLLWTAAMGAGYHNPLWMTFEQAKQLGGHVRSGQRGTMVVYAKTASKEEWDKKLQKMVPVPLFFLRSYTVFNVQQIEKLPGHYYATKQPEQPLTPEQRIVHADQFFKRFDAKIEHRGRVPCYIPATDKIQMPPFEQFCDPESYYSTLAHEHIHWTGHKDRLNRQLDGLLQNPTSYAREELVAELGSAFLCTDLSLKLHIREDHAGYVASWLNVLKSDNRAVFQAASQAQRAVDWLHREAEEFSTLDEALHGITAETPSATATAAEVTPLPTEAAASPAPFDPANEATAGRTPASVPQQDESAAKPKRRATKTPKPRQDAVRTAARQRAKAR